MDDAIALRRESDRRLDVLDDHVTELRERSARMEGAISGLQTSFQQHDTNNSRRFGEVHERITGVVTQVTRLEEADKQRAATLGDMDGKLDQLLAAKIATDAVSEDRIGHIKSLPTYAKWLAAVLGIPALLAGGWQAFTAFIKQ